MQEKPKERKETVHCVYFLCKTPVYDDWLVAVPWIMGHFTGVLCQIKGGTSTDKIVA